MKNKISILGSTGSIGLSTLKIIDIKKNFKIQLLSSNKNYKLICNQIKKYKPDIFIVNDFLTFRKVAHKFKKSKIKILNNFSNLKIKKKK